MTARNFYFEKRGTFNLMTVAVCRYHARKLTNVARYIQHLSTRETATVNCFELLYRKR